jgi:hypothetical protein
MWRGHSPSRATATDIALSTAHVCSPPPLCARSPARDWPVVSLLLPRVLGMGQLWDRAVAE